MAARLQVLLGAMQHFTTNTLVAGGPHVGTDHHHGEATVELQRGHLLGADVHHAIVGHERRHAAQPQQRCGRERTDQLGHVHDRVLHARHA